MMPVINLAFSELGINLGGAPPGDASSSAMEDDVPVARPSAESSTSSSSSPPKKAEEKKGVFANENCTLRGFAIRLSRLVPIALFRLPQQSSRSSIASKLFKSLYQRSC